MRGKLSWFDNLMIGVTYAEANVEEPELQAIDRNDWEHNEQESYWPLDNEIVLVR